jgi:phage major head subunit gpT-like protein
MALDTAKATVTLRTLTNKFDKRVAAAEPFYPRLCNIIQSDGADEAYGMLGDAPGVREWLGDRQFKEMRAANFVIANKHWESSLLIRKTDIADDRMGLYGPLMEQLGIEAAYHPDELLFETALANADATPCFDGQFFFDTDHVWGDSGTNDNDLTYNATDHTAVTAAEFRLAFHQARSAMLGFRNDQGKLLNRPVVTSLSQLMVIVPTELELAARVGLQSALLGGGDTNMVIDSPQIVVSPHLTSAVKFYLFNLGGALKPFVFQAREPISRQMKGMDDKETKDVKFMTEARYNVGYLAWWTGVQTTFN